MRIVFAEDNYLVREGTRALLETVDGLELVASVEDADQLLAAVAEYSPDVVLTDIRMPPTHTDEGIRAAIGVVVLSQFVDETYAYDLLKDGAEKLGYILKERIADLDELVRAMKAVNEGGSFLDPMVVEALVARKSALANSPLADLTDRERDVLSAMATGKNNAAIAASLFLSERAIEKHINSLFQKLGLSGETQVHRRVMAVLAFLREEGVPPSN
jgi:DNA-binding NarL/FixJ family response regulator